MIIKKIKEVDLVIGAILINPSENAALLFRKRFEKPTSETFPLDLLFEVHSLTIAKPPKISLDKN